MAEEEVEAIGGLELRGGAGGAAEGGTAGDCGEGYQE
jgi:hypothetical protein